MWKGRNESCIFSQSFYIVVLNLAWLYRQDHVHNVLVNPTHIQYVPRIRNIVKLEFLCRKRMQENLTHIQCVPRIRKILKLEFLCQVLF